MNRIVLQLDPSERNRRNSEGAFVTLAGGRVLFVYSRFSVSASDHGPAALASRYSDDGGRTWSPRDRVLVGREGRFNVMAPSLLRLRDGRIALAYLRKNSLDDCMPVVRFSSDEARTFAPAVTGLIQHRCYYGINNDRLVQLSTGRLILPIAMHRPRWVKDPGSAGRIQAMANKATVFFIMSDDGGRTWFESYDYHQVILPNGDGLQEPGVVELRDGRLWSWSRPALKGGRNTRQWQMFSKDGGLKWSAPTPSVFRSPQSPMSVKRIPAGFPGAGDLLAVWNDHSGRSGLPPAKPASKGRTPLVSAISADDGRTWRHHRLLERSSTHGYCYTAIHFVDDASGGDGAVLLAYCAGTASIGGVLTRLRVRRMSVAALYGRAKL